MDRARIALCLSLIALIGLGGCAASSPAEDAGVPEWVLSVPEDPRYAYGVGSAPLAGDVAEARRVATNRARGELLASMEVRVSGESRSWVERVRDGDSGAIARGFAEQTLARIPETTLSGIEVQSVEPDAAGETLYVLVRLDLPGTRMRLSTELNRLNRRIEAAAAGSPDTGDPLAVIRELGPAAALIEEARELESRLRLVSGGQLPMQPAEVEHADVLEELTAALDGLVVAVRGDEMPDRLRAGLESGLLENGVRVGGNSPPHLILDGNIRTRDVARGPDHFVHADAVIRVTDRSGRLLAQFNERVRVASTDRGIASDRAVRRLAAAVAETIGQRLFTMLGNI
jgi:hypothetical protein